MISLSSSCVITDACLPRHCELKVQIALSVSVSFLVWTFELSKREWASLLRFDDPSLEGNLIVNISNFQLDSLDYLWKSLSDCLCVCVCCPFFSANESNCE